MMEANLIASQLIGGALVIAALAWLADQIRNAPEIEEEDWE